VAEAKGPARLWRGRVVGGTGRSSEEELMEEYGLTGMTMEKVRKLPFWRRWPGIWNAEELMEAQTLRGHPQEKWGEILAERKAASAAAQTADGLQKQSSEEERQEAEAVPSRLTPAVHVMPAQAGIHGRGHDDKEIATGGRETVDSL